MVRSGWWYLRENANYQVMSKDKYRFLHENRKVEADSSAWNPSSGGTQPNTQPPTTSTYI